MSCPPIPWLPPPIFGAICDNVHSRIVPKYRRVPLLTRLTTDSICGTILKFRASVLASCFLIGRRPVTKINAAAFSVRIVLKAFARNTITIERFSTDWTRGYVSTENIAQAWFDALLPASHWMKSLWNRLISNKEKSVAEYEQTGVL